MANKIVNKLPVVLQTTAIKNFFESTVEQLYSEANTVNLKGFIGKKSGSDAAIAGAFIEEATADRREYNLSPTVNNINPITGESENLIFYDEFINTLKIYGVTTRNHNSLFGSHYQAFMPPIDIDKFINHQEYYWVPAGPSVIEIEATSSDPIDIDLDVVGKTSYTYGSVTLRNGMIISFADNGYTIPAASATASYNAGVDYIVGGVGTGIYLTRKDLTTATLYGGSNSDNKDYIVIERGAPNNNAWSRVNHWYHRDNFLDAGDELPAREYRANRPIIEFDRMLELYNHGTTYNSAVNIATEINLISDIVGQSSYTLDTYVLANGDTVLFVNESENNRKYVYTVGGVGVSITLTPGDEITEGEAIVSSNGFSNIGAEYVFDGTDFYKAQQKLETNQAPLFVLYDDNKIRLDDPGLYPQSSFAGNKIFGYKEGNGATDRELGFAVDYTPFKTVSEITFENFIQTDRVTYQVYGSTTVNTVLGSYYYKRLTLEPEFFSSWKPSDQRNQQKIITTHYIDRFDVDRETTVYDIGAVPNTNTAMSSGYDIVVKVNDQLRTDYTYYQSTKIKFNSFNLLPGDVIDISVVSDEGIILQNDSRFDIPLSWRGNPHNNEIELISEPLYLEHFKNYIENQEGFEGDPLASNNFSNLAKDVRFAKDIVQTDQDLILAAFLLDDQPHNLVDALRFSAREYEKYKARLLKEITSYYNTFDISELTNEYVLEQVLRNVTSYSVGKEVFNSTYVVPFGDNYLRQDFDIANTELKVYALADYLDIEAIENSLLVYHLNSNNELILLTVDTDYTVTSSNPIEITLGSSVVLSLGDTIITKLYDKNRDNVQCPPTPSTMGLYPLYVPAIEVDNSFQTPISVLVGHDGSKTSLFGDRRDELLLEFEKRVYNSARIEFREVNSLPLLNVFDVRSGAFRDNNLSVSEYTDLLRNSFSNWVGYNNVDYVINETFSSTNKWTWNYRGTQNLPGYWKGLYEYYYDTVRPHTHPWEMLAFFEKPTWWDTQYGTDYGSLNTAMWSDIEEGIIRSGTRENLTNGRYLVDNPFRRIGLSNILPVNESAELITPDLIANTGSTVKIETWYNQRLASTDVTDQIADYVNSSSNNLPDNIVVTYNTSNVYITNNNIGETYQLNNSSFSDFTSSNVALNATATGDTYIGVTVTGVPIVNPTSASTWNSEGTWQYNEVYAGTEHETGTYVILPEHAGLTEWDTANHSPIVGWAFDGLPIYGPYGYADAMDDTSNIVPIKSCFILSAADRTTGPRGKTTGQFVNDYNYDASTAGTDGFTGGSTSAGVARYNMRYGVTPESPSTPIYYYVATIDDNGDPMFPYVIGGTVTTSTIPYKSTYFTTPINLENNNTGSVVDLGTSTAITSSLTVSSTANENYIDSAWRFGDGAPVENAWKYSVGYPFAVVEAALLARPGRFATVFSDPNNIVIPATEQYKIISSVTRLPWDFRSSADFRIHGDINSGQQNINVGYTQFIHSWLAYQQLNTKTDFADKLRTVNIKLAHRVAGFTDKDTLTIRTDQISQTGSQNSLIIPSENFNVVVHSSPYKNRNFYSGVMIQKTATGYKVRGYDKNFGYFNVQRLNLRGKTSKVEVGGVSADYSIWEPNKSFAKDSIVTYNSAYYRATAFVSGSETFVAALWQRLPSLPQVGAVRATVYLDSLPQIDRVDYETEYTTHQEVVDLLVGLGVYQEALGFNFGNFDNEINDVRNWNYSVKQFLFWVSGGWETNNILELSPLASKVSFTSTSGMVAKINRVEKNQFALLDQNSRAIQPTECEIVRDGTSIEIIPPAGTQIYAAMLFTKEIEHAMVFDNITNFNDTIYNQLYNQQQKRLRVKGIKTANWNGTLASEGFIIRDNELKPNLDNMAQSLGRYHELGFIPVEKQIYDTARSLYGYQERTYLNELEIDDDDQFEFYTGMLQEKGTLPSLSKIAKSNAIVQGEMTVYDEWAVRVGDFGDLENDQSIELKIEKNNVTANPQLVTLAFPEDTTGVIKEIRVISSAHTYYENPTIEIAAPSRTPAVQATAAAVLASNGTLSGFTITNRGSGYSEPVRLQVIAGDLFVSNVSTTFNTPVAMTSDYLLSNVVSLGLTTIEITDHLGNSNVTIDISAANTVIDVVDAINLDASINANISASYVEGYTIISGSVVSHYSIQITGPDFSLVENGTTLANLNLTEGRYQPTQRYSISAVGNHPTKGTGATTESNIVVTVNGLPVAATSNWSYDAGSRTQYNYVPDFLNTSSTDEGTFVGNVNITLTTTIDPTNTVDSYGTYPHVDVFVDGYKLVNIPSEIKYTIAPSLLTLYNVETLPNGFLPAGANVYVYEHPTIEFSPAYTNDLPGSTLNIKTVTNDHVAILTESVRLYDIMEDVAGDEVILIDIDDSTRFLKKPIGVKENALWPTTSNVDYTGIVDDVSFKIPNAGYVNKSNVDFRSFDIMSIADMFDDERTIHPRSNSIIHVAVSENRDWNVYKLSQANVAGTSFIETEGYAATTYLYTGQSLFDHVDTNRIGQDDLGRYLDYHVAIKQGQTNEKFVVWVNEEVVNRKQVRLSNISGVKMKEGVISSIGPESNSILAITDIIPGVSGFGVVSATVLDTGGNVLISGDTFQLENGDAVSFASYLGNTVPLHANTYVVFDVDDVNGTFTINDSNLAANIVANITSNISNSDENNIVVITSSEVAPFLTDGSLVTLTDEGINIGPYVLETLTIDDVEEIDNISFIITLTSSDAAALLVEGDTINLTDEGNTILANTFIVSSVDTTSNTFTIPLEAVDSSAVTNAIAIAGNITLTANIAQTILSNTFAVSNVSLGAFTIDLAGVDSKTFIRAGNVTLNASNIVYRDVDVTYYGKTLIESVGHNLFSGDIVKIDAGRYSGLYLVEKATANTFVIDTPWSNGSVTTGNILLDKIEITTEENHGIDNGYVGKTIAVHRADPKYYNQVYVVDSLTANTIVAKGRFPYSSEIISMSNTGCVFSTLDHNLITINGSKIKLDNIKSVDGIVDSFNRSTQIKRGYVTKTGSFSMSMPMLDQTILPDGITLQQIAGGIPYVTADTATGLSTDNLRISGSITVDPAITTKVGFNNDLINSNLNVVNRTITSATSQTYDSTLNVSPWNTFVTVGSATYNDNNWYDQGTAFPFWSPNTGTYFPAPMFEDYTEGASYVVTDMVGQTRLINIPTVVATPNPVNNNQVPINSGAVIINPTAIVAIPTKNVCGDIISLPAQPNTNTSTGATEYRSETFTNIDYALNVTDTWYYKIDASGTVRIVFNMYSDADKIVVKRGSTTVADTSQGFRTATSDELFAINGDDMSIWNGGPSVYGYTSNNSIYYPQYDDSYLRPVDVGSGYITNIGVFEFYWDASLGTSATIEVHKSADSMIYKAIIYYPTSAAAISNPKQNSNPGQSIDPNGFIPDTPIIQPATVAITKKISGSSMPGVTNRLFYNAEIADGGYYNNYGGFSQAPMAGFTFIPSVFKKEVKTTLQLNQSRYGTPPTSTGAYVNSAGQRRSGGVIVPLAQRVAAPISVTPQTLRSIDLANDPMYITSGLGSAGTKDFNLLYQPIKIGSDSYDVDALPLVDSSNNADTIIYAPLAGEIPTTVPGTPFSDTSIIAGYLSEPKVLEPEDSPVDIENVVYNDIPVITVTPKIKNEDGDYVPAGPTAYCKIARPTPALTLGSNDLIGVQQGDELIINGQSVIMQADPNSTLDEIKFLEDPNFIVSETLKDGDRAIKISSCSNAPITVRDGCAGGAYKEVLDFHVVKSFSLIDSNAVANTPNGFPIEGDNFTYQKFSFDGKNLGSGERISNNTRLKGILGVQTTTETRSLHTGGSNYKVGDRLRLVGGTPVATPYSTIESIRVTIPGANYTSAANVRVYIGDGITPGRGARVATDGTGITLDENNGIRSIRLAEVDGEVLKGYGYDPANPPRVRIIDLGEDYSSTPIVGAEAVVVLSKNTGVDRVAKFRVTSVNATGGVTGLYVIDRGVYKIFPSDLTSGLPLEYDSEIDYNEDNTGSQLGVIDPITGETLPPAWNQGSGQGTGVRVYLTSREIPDCSERGNAKTVMKIPDFSPTPNLPEHLADLLNAGLIAAGYDPNDISFSVQPINGDISALTFNTPTYDGVEFDELTPGMLDKLGIEPGDYNPDVIEYHMENATPENDDTDSNIPVETIAIYGVDTTPVWRESPYTQDQANVIYGNANVQYDGVTGIVQVLDGGFSRSGNNSILGNADVKYIDELYQYELRTLDNTPVTAPLGTRNVQVLVVESLRYANTSVMASANVAFPSSNIPASAEYFANVWIDSFTAGDLANLGIASSDMPDFVNNGWAYLENGVPKRWQTPMVDTKYIKNTILYDSTTGKKDFDYSMWDPFKGVLPADIAAELSYVSMNDPVVYTVSRSAFGKDNVGQIWWDTSTIRYNWYEQGPNRERWLNWGSSFVGSGVTVYEWVESSNPPAQYTGTGAPKNFSEFIVERRINPSTKNYELYYYYWVQNVSELSNAAILNQKRKFTALQLARYIADPNGQGLNTIGFISAGSDTSTNLASFVISNLTNTLREDEQNLQINLSRNLNPTGIKHAAWKLLREGDDTSDIPEDLISKMIDSLCEQDLLGNIVPAENLSEVERYGTKFRPRQTMFRYPAEARRVLHYVVNEMLADMQLNTLTPGWDSSLVSNNYINTVNWYNVIKIDNETNQKIRYNSTYKPTFTVASVKELDTLVQSKLPDGVVIMVRASVNERYQLWKWVAKTSSFELIAIENETVELSTAIYTDENNDTLKSELRSFLEILRDVVFVGTEKMNLVFFALMKYAIVEQQQLDWAFKTSYLYVEKEEEDLVQRTGYKPDNFQPVIDYLNEVKPFNAKIREYRDGKRAPLEYIKDQMISDYDLPPYADPVVGQVRILNLLNESDKEIMSTNGDYVKAYNGYSPDQDQWDTANTPVRVSTTTLTFDRVDWRLLEYGFDAANTSYAVSIANNIANINMANLYTVGNTDSNAYSMSARIFKFDPEVRTQFNTDIDAYFGTGASSNTSIIENSSTLALAIENGALNGTLYMVKQKVGGDWNGEVLDANVFSKVVYGTDSLTLQSVYGYDTYPWDAGSGIGSEWDTYIEVENYEGIFVGNTTFREAGITYDGFDGFSFKHLLYGEERPEELVYLSPLENFIIHVRTNPFVVNESNVIVSAITIGPYVLGNISVSDANNIVTISSTQAAPLLENNAAITLIDEGNTILNSSFIVSNVTSTTFTIELAGVDSTVISNAGNVTLTSGVEAVPVEYIAHYDMFGGVEYTRIRADGSKSTRLLQPLNYWDDTIHVEDASVLPVPRPGIPGVIWINHTERVEYRRIIGNSLTDITRGTRGTTIPGGTAVVLVSGDIYEESNTVYKHEVSTVVTSGELSEVFNSPESGEGFSSRNPDNRANWLNPNMLSLTDVTNSTVNTPIAKFLQGFSVTPVGWDSVGWGELAWDSI